MSVSERVSQSDIHKDDTAFHASSLACPTRFTATSAIDHDDEFGLARADCPSTRSGQNEGTCQMGFAKIAPQKSRHHPWFEDGAVIASS